MLGNVNPFQQLYFSDDTHAEKNYVALFSPEVLQTAIHPVFQGGNVVLSGAQGCGKTMILSLLRPETRIAYHELREKFPVDAGMSDFLAAGVNLTRSRLSDIVHVTLGKGDDHDTRELPYYFADFFDYWVVDDLLKSVELVGKNPGVFGGIVDQSKIPAFVKQLANADCWFGALAGVRTLDDLKERLRRRVQFYRAWVNGNLAGLPPADIQQSKTNIGEPIARAAQCLRDAGVIKEHVPVLIRVDQIEEMHRAFTDRPQRLLLEFRRMLNRAFAARDARVHYRIGTRRYGWNRASFLEIWGSGAKLENRRDYHLIDMDTELFALGEAKNSIFDRLAVDAFQRRVAYYDKRKAADLKPELAKSVFGKAPRAPQRISQLSTDADDSQIDRALATDSAADRGRWSTQWLQALRSMYREGHEGMLDAVLAAAWGRQTGGAANKHEHRDLPPPTEKPWKSRRWWRKERLDQAVLQLMARCQQRFVWWGYEDIRSLSGGNITVFLHICHRIWDGHLKSESGKPQSKRLDLLGGDAIHKDIQAAGILFASNEWYNKMPEEPGGDSRLRFVEQLGTRLNHEMMLDAAMSYPGASGVSFRGEEYTSAHPKAAALREFVRDAVGYGVLVEIEHASRAKGQSKRFKVYLSPILCPRFQLPEARTKEPRYWTMDDLSETAQRAKVTFGQVSSATQEKFPGF
jgi:hypothetical protein